MKKLITLFLVAFLVVNAFSQNKSKEFAMQFSHNFGEVTSADINMKSYPKDTTAGAIVIYDIGNTKFILNSEENGYDIVFKRRKRIKIFKKSAFGYAEIEIPFFEDGEKKEEITELTAFTINVENGVKTVHKVKENNIFLEKRSNNWYVKKFAFSNVKEGSIIEFGYTLKTPYITHAPDWEFQDLIPTIYSKYVINTIPFYEYQWILQGATKFDEYVTYEENGYPRFYYTVEFNDIINKFVMIEVPAFKDEDFIASIQDYIVKLDFQLSYFHSSYGSVEKVITTWKLLNKELLSHDNFGKYANKSKSSYKKIVKTNNLLEKNEKDRVNFIVQNIKNNYNWNGIHSKYAGKKNKKFLKEKTGNSAEINLYLLGALRSAKIEAYPVILSTRKHGKITKKYPFSSFFNNVIVIATINGKKKLLDATDTYCSNFLIPTDCINNEGLLIDKKKSGWVSLRPKIVSMEIIDIKTTLSEDLDIQNGNFTIQYTNYKATLGRKMFQNENEKIEKYFSSEGLENIEKIKTEEYKNNQKPYRIYFDANIETEIVGDKIFINPFFGQTISENPFKNLTRKSPVDLIYPKLYMFKNTITLPDNCKLEKLPENFSFSDDLISINYQAKKVSENKIEVMASYNLTKGVYKASEYPRLKYSYKQIIKYFNQKIVVVEEQ